MNPTTHVGLTARRSPRRALTVVELLVVMTIMGLLATIVAVVAPKFSDASRVAEGSRQFTSWLQLARQRAQRDSAARGLRILDTGNDLKRFAYVEQPEDISAVAYEIYPFRNDPPYMFGNTPPNGQDSKRIAQRNAFQTAAAGQFPANSPYWNLLHPTKNADGWKYLVYLPAKNLSGAVNTGDVIEFAGARYSLICVPVQLPASTDPTGGCVLVINRSRDEFRPNSADIFALPALPPVRITRSPRPIAGEPELTLPSNIAIDLSRCVLGNSVGGGGGVFDVVFAPSGDAIGAAGATGRVIFWVRDLSLVDPGPNTMPDGDNRLIALHCRTGHVTAHPVNPDVDTNGKLTDPYKFVRDGKSSALED